MTTPDAALGWLARHTGADTTSASLVTVGVLATLAAVLVGLGTFAAIESGYAAVGLSFVASIVLFVATLTVFEAGRKVGAES